MITNYNTFNEKKQITFNESDDDRANWSPDGNMIAFTSERSGKSDIWITSISGGEPIRFTKESKNSWPSWSPDGKKIAFSSYRDGNRGIWVKALDTDMLGSEF